MTSELKPCQFCGGEAETHETTDGWIVSCSSDQNVLDGFTHMAHAYGGTEPEAIDAWNTRAERTCTVEKFKQNPSYGDYYCELSCGHYFDVVDDKPPAYCPICGAKVVEG